MARREEAPTPQHHTRHTNAYMYTHPWGRASLRGRPSSSSMTQWKGLSLVRDGLAALWVGGVGAGWGC